MRKVSLILAITIISSLCLTSTAAAQSRQMYRWTDENGVVHFTDERPAGQEVTIIDIPDSEPPAASPAVPTDEANEPSLAQQRRDEIAQRRQENREQAAVLEAECAAKRAEVAGVLYQ
jgi:hypothetical protein